MRLQSSKITEFIKVKLIDVMVWWDCLHDGTSENLPKIKILDVNAEDNHKYSYLGNSNGACCGGWRSMGQQRRAASLIAMVFEAIIKEGVPPQEAHDELNQIDEYREWLENFEGPFADVYRGDPVRSDDNE